MSVNLLKNGELVKVSGGGGGSIATTNSPGIVQPDNSTINVDENGVISSTNIDTTARASIETLNGSVSTVGSVDYKIAQAVGNLSGFEVVPAIPVQNPNTKTIYLVKDTSAAGSDKYKEYIWNSTDGYILIGDTSIDLSNYVENTDYATSSVGGVVKIDGTNMSISNGVIIALKVNGHTVATDVPANAVFTDTTYDKATNSAIGLVRGDGTNTSVDNNGILTALKVNGHSVAKDVPSDAVFTDTTALGSMTGTLSVEHGGTGATTAANARTNLGLGNVGNFKAVSTVASQGLTDTEKSNARANIGAGTSSFSGSYNDLSNKPTLGTAAAKEVDIEVTKNSTNLITSGGVFNALIPLKGLYPWSTATNEQITNMIDKYYSGELTLDDIKSVWTVGDTRTVTLSAMSATGVGESHRSQSVEMQIIDFDHDILTTPQGGKTKALITIDLKNCLRDANVADDGGSSNTEHGYMNSSNTNVGGWTSCARRTWCNDVYYNALPTYLKNRVKPVNKLTSAGNQSSTINTDSDKCFLLSEIEVFGSTTYSKAGEGSQYAHYTKASNRYKLPKWDSSYVSDFWWERSPYESNTTAFCFVDIGGDANGYNASAAAGLAPACCL